MVTHKTKLVILINTPANYQHVNMLTSAVGSKPNCAWAQADRATSMAVDSWSC